MEQHIIDWTAFLDDDGWFIPEPPPAGAGHVDAPPVPADFQDQSSTSNMPPFQQHPTPSLECCRRRALPGNPFMGWEEPLGHFGVGFPEGHYPETVPGSFTATQVELGKRWSIFDDNLFQDLPPDSSKVPSEEETAAESSWEDEWPRDFTSNVSDPTEPPREGDDLPDVELFELDGSVGAESVSAEEHSECNESISDFDGGKPDSATTASCSSPIAEDHGILCQESLQKDTLEQPTGRAEEEALHHMEEELTNQVEENEDCFLQAPVETVSGPKQHRRKRKLPKSSEFIDQCDSDSDYTPDPRKKKWPRPGLPARTQNAKETAARRRPANLRAEGKKLWRVQPKAAPKPRIKLQVTPWETSFQQQPAAEYAHFANMAEYAESATRARFALQATCVRPRPGVSYSEADELPLTFLGLQGSFESVKQRLGARPSQKAQRAQYADIAGDALYARHATSTEMLIKVG